MKISSPQSATARWAAAKTYVFVSAEGGALPYFRAGECGWCRSRLLSGKVFIPQENELRRWAAVEYGYIHPCCSFPVSDFTIEVPGEYL